MPTPELTLITCTSDRPEALELCQRYVRRQRWTGGLDWIVVDDGEEPAQVDPASATRVRQIRLPAGLAPMESFRKNMLTALKHVEADKILIIEDDDWYHPDYIGFMSGLLDVRPLVGEGFARYYHVAQRRWTVRGNVDHASLCTTGFRVGLVPVVRNILTESRITRPENPQQLDGSLWKRSRIPEKFKLLLPKSPHVVGIKGMPGKRGLGIDHQRSELQNYRSDPDLDKLHKWIGDDAEYYAKFFIDDN